ARGPAPHRARPRAARDDGRRGHRGRRRPRGGARGGAGAMSEAVGQSAPPAIIELEDVSVVLGERTVLHRVTLTVTERRLGVIGANGSGKSTLARVIGGLTAPTSGRALVAGTDPARDGRSARALIGFTFADPDAQIVMPTVR